MPVALTPGDAVRIRDQRWRVVRVTSRPPLTVVAVASLESPPERDASFLLPFEPCEALPFDRSPRRVSRPQWRRVVRRILAEAMPGWTALRTPAAADVTLLPFQLEPALALLRGDACRLLIADTVGLGKTIQAGVILGEMLARLPHARALIVAPAGLREQWAQELADRFHLTPRIVDAGGLLRAARALPPGLNPWSTAPLVVTSIDYVKRPDVMRALEGLIWDVVVFDEAHALTGRSDRAAAASALAQRARVVVMLSATPHSGDDESYGRLQRLGALGRGGRPLVFRRTRNDIGAGMPRRSRSLRIRPTAAEGRMHQALASYAQASLEADLPGAHLAISVLRRRASSSASSLAASLGRRIALLTAPGQPATGPQLALPFGAAEEDDAAPGVELGAPALTDRDAELQRLGELLQLANEASVRESKLAALARLLRRVGEPAIVFTEYRDTLRTMAASLGVPCVELHGGLATSERRQALDAFTRGEAPLLLATDAASEGLNLHRRCRLVINLELPWSSVRLEQRIGRVDRLGQTRVVHAVHLVAATTLEESLRARLHAKEERAGAVASTAPASLAGLAGDECRRIATVRMLLERAASECSQRPVVTVTAARRPLRLTSHHVRITDARGDVLWHSLAGSPEPLLPADQVGRWLTQRSLAELAPFLRTMQGREDEIVEALQQQRARLSALLLQHGLFDRRTERQASAQRLLADEATAHCRERAMLLQAMAGARAILGLPAFSIAPAR